MVFFVGPARLLLAGWQTMDLPVQVHVDGDVAAQPFQLTVVEVASLPASLAALPPGRLPNASLTAV